MTRMNIRSAPRPRKLKREKPYPARVENRTATTVEASTTIQLFLMYCTNGYLLHMFTYPSAEGETGKSVALGAVRISSMVLKEVETM